MHKVGMRRIERELDITHFIRKQLEVRALIRAMSSTLARRLARRHYSLILNDSQEEVTISETDSDFDITVCKPQTELEN